MKHFLQIPGLFDTAPLAAALQMQPELWNQIDHRTARAGSPHAATSDIWVRMRDWADYDKMPYEEFCGPHHPVWYPVARALPQIRPIVFGLMARVEATAVGAILLTRIPPRESVLPHADIGWHSSFYNMKLHVPIATNPQCINRVEDERVRMGLGEIWYMNNLVEHEVVNDGPTERITLIICLRTEP